MDEDTHTGLSNEEKEVIVNLSKALGLALHASMQQYTDTDTLSRTWEDVGNRVVDIIEVTA